MTIDNILVLAILVVALILFVSERLRVDVVAMLVLAALILTGLVPPEEAFSGFASPAVVTVGAVFIISGALYKTGVADAIGELMLRIGGSNPLRVLVIMMATVVVLGTLVGLTTVRDQLLGELGDIGLSIATTNQSYSVSAITGHAFSIAGSERIDRTDDCDVFDPVCQTDTCIAICDVPATSESG